jgi:CheY-like chemotaxis protein
MNRYLQVGADSEERSDQNRMPYGVVRPTRVLVVEDERLIARSMALALTGMGREVRIANTGQDALEQAAAFRPDVVLLDIGLPDMDGWETARALRRLPNGNSLRLVAITGHGDEAARLQSRAAGFDEHLVKPVTTAQLAALFAEAGASRAA